MRVKSFYAGTMDQALAMARKELGPDALLLNSQHARPDAQHLGRYEVVFGVADDAAPAQSPRLQPESAQAHDRFAGSLQQEVSDLRKEMEILAARLARAASITRPNAGAAAASVLARLLEADMDPAQAQDLVAEGESLSAAGGEDVARCVSTIIRGRLKIDDSVGKTARIIAVVGPPGVGKTTSLAKLAVRYGIALRKRCHIISLDTIRVAAAEQLRSYAMILGASFEVADTPLGLEQAITANSSKDLIFIDTPGLAIRDFQDGWHMMQALVDRSDVESYLVLSAAMRSRDLAATADRFDILRPQKLLFTRLDETASFGALVSVVMRKGLPVSFVSRGQQIPEDLEPASAFELAGAVVGIPAAAAVAAAA